MITKLHVPMITHNWSDPDLPGGPRYTAQIPIDRGFHESSKDPAESGREVLSRLEDAICENVVDCFLEHRRYDCSEGNLSKFVNPDLFRDYKCKMVEIDILEVVRKRLPAILKCMARDGNLRNGEKRKIIQEEISKLYGL